MPVHYLYSFLLSHHYHCPPPPSPLLSFKGKGRSKPRLCVEGKGGSGVKLKGAIVTVLYCVTLWLEEVGERVLGVCKK